MNADAEDKRLAGVSREIEASFAAAVKAPRTGIKKKWAENVRALETTGLEIHTSIKIADVIVQERFRKDVGDLGLLCESIQKIGLLHPIILTPKRELVVGFRRLEAVKKLGRSTIECRVIATLADAIPFLTAERDENTCRKDFTPTEAIALGEKLEQLERPKATERKKATLKRGTSKSGNVDRAYRQVLASEKKDQAVTFDTTLDDLTIELRRFFDRLVSRWPKENQNLLAAQLRGLADEVEHTAEEALPGEADGTR